MTGVTGNLFSCPCADTKDFEFKELESRLSVYCYNLFNEVIVNPESPQSWLLKIYFG